MTESTLHTAFINGVQEISLNRLERRNAVNPSLVVELHAALQAAELDQDVGAVLVYGNGEHFRSGLDLKDPDVGSVALLWQQLHRFIASMHTPLVIAHHGAAINAGAALALSGDLLVSGETAFLQIMEARIGMTPPVNLAWLLYRHSRAVATRLSLSCDRVTGHDLGALGLAYAIVPDDGVVERVRELAGQIAEYPKRSGVMIKQLLNGPGASFDEILDGLLQNTQ
ncbi:MAG: enoyl-CoA hydratase/isomerase family protein [Cumulibacter sp.]